MWTKENRARWRPILWIRAAFKLTDGKGTNAHGL